MELCVGIFAIFIVVRKQRLVIDVRMVALFLTCSLGEFLSFSIQRFDLVAAHVVLQASIVHFL